MCRAFASKRSSSFVPSCMRISLPTRSSSTVYFTHSPTVGDSAKFTCANVSDSHATSANRANVPRRSIGTSCAQRGRNERTAGDTGKRAKRSRRKCSQPVASVLRTPDNPLHTAFSLLRSLNLMPRFLPALLIVAVALVAGALRPPLAEAVDPPAAPKITWKKTVLDRQFRSEGVAVADVNKDGKIDVLNGEYWYEAPDWTPHEMQPFFDHAKETQDGLKGYSRVFFCWADDINGDGWQDLIVIDFPGAPCYWMENPKGQSRGPDGKQLHWKKHTIWHSACNETPLYTDLLGNGKRVLVMGYQPEGKKQDGNEGRMAYFTPDPKDPTAKWIAHPISDPDKPGAPGTQRFSHGLGAGDINGDGRADVICTGGWWEQPEKPDGKTPWKFTPANFGAACADMFAYDVDGNGLNDVISTSA